MNIKIVLIISLNFLIKSTFSQDIPTPPNLIDSAGLRQGKWTITLDKDWAPTSIPDSIIFYRLIEYRNDTPLGITRDYYRSGQLQWEGKLLADRPEEVMDGRVVWYREDGSKETVSEYRNGELLSREGYDKEGTLLLSSLDLNRAGLKAYERGDYGKAVENLKQALKQGELEFGKWHLNYATFLNNLALIHYKQGVAVKAEPLFQEAILIIGVVLGKLNLSYASTLINLAALYQGRGNYEKAQPLYLEAKTIFEKVKGRDHPNYGVLLDNLASLYHGQGDYKKAEPLYLDAIEIQGKALGKEHPDYATTLNNLAAFYQDLGAYAKAERLYLEALPIMSKHHPDYLTYMSNLAGFYMVVGDYKKAEPIFQEVMSSRKKAFGELNPDYALSLAHLATLSQAQGNYKKAELLYLEAKVIFEKTPGVGHSDYATTLNNLAALYKGQGEYTKAEPLYLVSMAIREKALGKEHPDYAQSLHNLASLYQAQGNYKKAEPHYIEAMAIRGKILSKEHPDYALSLNNLADLYQILGDYEKAEQFFLEAMTIWEGTFGKKHFNYVLSVKNLADLYYTKGDHKKATPLFREALDVLLLQIDQNFSHLSEKEKDSYFQTFDYNFEAFHSFVVDHAVDNSELLAQDFRYLLATKGLLFDSSEKVRDRVLNNNDTALFRLYNEWRDQGQYVNSLYRAPLKKRKERGINLDKEAEQLNTLEKELSSRSALFASSRDTVKHTWQDIRGQLLSGEAAVEMVRFNYYKKQWTDSVIYMALIVTPETEDHPELVVMADGNKMENDHLKAYRRRLKKNDKDAESYSHYWAPISGKLVGIKKVYFSGDGVYHNISLAGLYDEADGNYLADKLTIHRVSGTAQLLETVREREPMNQAYLVGAPSFNEPKGIVGADDWAPLPYTLKEVDTLKYILEAAGIPTTVYTKDKATEEEVKSWDNPRIVHVASHAFFLENKAIQHSQRQQITGLDQLTLYQNPLLRSVMLLANAKGELYGEGTSGVLSAKEVLNLKLDQTELVVLSACETGKGVIKNGEGIYGLQRAFLTAGAETVLASLWKVDDGVTQELMADFYKNWLIDGLSKREAFIQARKSIKDKYGAPRYWAAFVMIGQ